MPGRKTSRASPERDANNAAMPMPNSELSTNCTVERCARRTTSSATVATTLMISDSLRSWEMIQQIVNSAVGHGALDDAAPAAERLGQLASDELLDGLVRVSPRIGSVGSGHASSS